MRAAAAVLVLAAACGGSSADRPASRHAKKPPAAVKVQPLAVDVSAGRQGSTLRVAVTGVARGHAEGEAYEDPASWTVEARAAGADLRRLVNAETSVEREPVGEALGEQWDVTVRFTVYFQLPAEAGAVDVRVSPPAPDDAQDFHFELSADADEGH